MFVDGLWNWILRWVTVRAMMITMITDEYIRHHKTLLVVLLLLLLLLCTHTVPKNHQTSFSTSRCPDSNHRVGQRNCWIGRRNFFVKACSWTTRDWKLFYTYVVSYLYNTTVQLSQSLDRWLALHIFWLDSSIMILNVFDIWYARVFWMLCCLIVLHCDMPYE